MVDAEAEAGFSLLEVIVCVALLMLGSVLTLALVPAIARASQTQMMREAATGIARNAIERVRAATAYDPPAALGDATTRTATASTHGWALRPQATYTAAARVRRALCGGATSSTDVPMTVTLSYDQSTDAVTVAVGYPPDPCAPATLATVTLTAELAPAANAPQTRIATAIADPAQQ